MLASLTARRRIALATRIIGVVVFAAVAALGTGASTSALAITGDEASCLVSLNVSGAKVVAAQGKESALCVKLAGRNALGGATLDECVAADARGKVADAADKTVRADASRCAAPPPFGYTGAATVNGVAVAAEIALGTAIFGTPMQDAVVTDGEGAACQASVAKAYERLAAARMREFAICKKLAAHNDALNGTADVPTRTTAGARSATATRARHCRLAPVTYRFVYSTASLPTSQELSTWTPAPP